MRELWSKRNMEDKREGDKNQRTCLAAQPCPQHPEATRVHAVHNAASTIMVIS